MSEKPDKPDEGSVSKCGECGYDITGLETGICPECGAGFFVGGDGLLRLRDALQPGNVTRCKVCGNSVQAGATKCSVCGCRLMRAK